MALTIQGNLLKAIDNFLDVAHSTKLLRVLWKQDLIVIFFLYLNFYNFLTFTNNVGL
jgi:hypothetical protein